MLAVVEEGQPAKVEMVVTAEPFLTRTASLYQQEKAGLLLLGTNQMAALVGLTPPQVEIHIFNHLLWVLKFEQKVAVLLVPILALQITAALDQVVPFLKVALALVDTLEWAELVDYQEAAGLVVLEAVVEAVEVVGFLIIVLTILSIYLVEVGEVLASLVADQTAVAVLLVHQPAAGLEVEADQVGAMGLVHRVEHMAVAADRGTTTTTPVLVIGKLVATALSALSVLSGVMAVAIRRTPQTSN